MEYTPDKWVILKLTDKKETIYKVLAGWSGSYLEGQSWKINSGITKVEVTDTHYFFHGYTGSVYKCSKHGYGMNMIMSSVYAGFKNAPEVELLEEQDFTNLKVA